jgi:glycosyltransferase involved in cell wall biosynthesis
MNERPLQVLHLRDTEEIGGPGKTILETHRAIDRARFCLHVGVFVTGSEPSETPFVRAARQCGLPVHVIRGGTRYDVRMVLKVVELVRRLQIDILHAHESKSDVIAYLASRLRKVPLATTLHGWIANGAKQRLLTAIDKRVLRRYDRVIAVSSEIRREVLAHGVDEKRVSLVHNAVAMENYQRSGRRGYLEDWIGRALERPIVTTVGRLSREKGHADLLHALSMVSPHAGLSAVLVGDGPERSRLIDLAAELGLEGRVYLPGYSAEPARVLEDTDLMVLPSHTEGLPNAVLEALAMEVPVLATAVGGTPEVITDGETGRLVPPRSPALLAGGIMSFVADPESWRRLAARGREVVRTHFSFEARTRKLEAIYTALAERSS